MNNLHKDSNNESNLLVFKGDFICLIVLIDVGPSRILETLSKTESAVLTLTMWFGDDIHSLRVFIAFS